MNDIKPEISILLPSIRTDRLSDVYLSICNSTKRSFELIVVGPYPLSPLLQAEKNVKYAKDFGSPMRASEIAAELAEGFLVTWTADDALFLPDALDKGVDTLYAIQPTSDKNVVISKYYEGQGYSSKNEQPDSYYKINNAWPKSPHIPDDWWIFNMTIMYRSFYEYLGGWDCQFQSVASGHVDMAIRAQRAGANVVLSNYPLVNCDHMPGTSGDHAPMHNAQTYEDGPLYNKIYSQPLESRDIRINIKNWKNSPAVWKKRFN